MFPGVSLTWEDLGVPVDLIPAPFPFLPLPRGLVNRIEGMGSWSAYALRPGNIMESLGTVWGMDEEEALEALENLCEVEGITYSALKVERS